MASKFTVLMAAILVAAIAAPSAQAPIVNALVRHRPASGNIARDVQTIAQEGIGAWIGYKVPIVTARGTGLRDTGYCCGTRCRLEPATELIVLARVADREMVELRTEAVDCDIDASGMPLFWLDGVKPEDSVAWLAGLAREQQTAPAGRTLLPTRIADRALSAIALHATPAANPVLVDAARNGSTTAIKGRALTWLAQRAAADALPEISRALEQDTETQIKRQAVSALAQMPKDDSIPRLIQLARTHSNPEVRRQAMFWLGQSKDQRAVDFFAAVLK